MSRRWFNRFASTKLPRLANVTLGELCLVALTIIAFGAAGHFLWGASTTTYLWLLGLTLWGFVNRRKNKVTWDRFDEIDQRDMDFKDEFDRKYERLSSDLEGKANKQTSIGAYAEGFLPKKCDHSWDRDGERCTKCGDKDWM